MTSGIPTSPSCRIPECAASRLEPLFYPKRSRPDRKTRLLEHFCYLPGRAKQLKLRLLPRIVGIEEDQPLIVFIEVCRFQISQAAAALIELHLQNVQIFLGELQFEARHVSRKIGFAHLPRHAPDIERKLAAFFREQQLSGAQIGSRKCDCGRGAGGKNWDANFQTKYDIVTLKFLEEIGVIVGIAQNI